MTGKDTNTEEVLQTIEAGLKISLQVTMNEQGQVGIQCDYNKASSTLLLQTIAYMLDTAYRGEQDLMVTVAEQIPDIVTEYCRLKDLQEEVEDAEEMLDDTIESLDTEFIKQQIQEELQKENMNVDLVMKLTSELMKRKVKEVEDDGKRE